MLTKAFELRYQVYCVERGFLPRQSYPDGRETDHHDDESAHFGAFDGDDELAGYVRLVQSRTGQFPFQDHCATLFNDGGLPMAHEAAEVSRLMVRQDYRCGQRDHLRMADGNDATPINGRQTATESARILVNLYRQMYVYSVNNGIRYWYAAMEGALARSLMRWNFAFRQISPTTDYFGPVALYLADLREVEARVGASNPALLAWLQAPESHRAPGDWRIEHVPCGSLRTAEAALPARAAIAAAREIRTAAPKLALAA